MNTHTFNYKVIDNQEKAKKGNFKTARRQSVHVTNRAEAYMNVLKTLSLAFIAVLCAPMSYGQFSNEIDLTGPAYRGRESSKLVVSSAQGPIVVGTVAEGIGSFSHDIHVIQFDNTGSVLWDINFGNANVNEGANGAVLYNGTDLIIVGHYDHQQALIVSIDIATGSVNWSRALGSFNSSSRESLVTLAQEGTTGNFHAVGTVKMSGNSQLYTVKFSSTGTIFWTNIIQPGPSVQNTLKLSPINLIDDPTFSNMVLVGSVVSGATESIFVSYLNKSNGSINSLHVYAITNSQGSMHARAGDICLAPHPLNNSIALTATAYNSTFTSSTMVVSFLNHNTGPTNLFSYAITGYQIMNGNNPFDFNHGLNIYKEGRNFDIGIKYGTSPSSLKMGFLKLFEGGPVVNLYGYRNLNDLTGSTMSQNGTSGYYLTSSHVLSGGNGGFDITSVDQSGYMNNQCFDTPDLIEDNSMDITPTYYDHIYASHGFTAPYTLSSITIGGINKDCSGAWGGFKRKSLSANQLAENNGSVYPTIVSNDEIITAELTNETDDNLQLTVTNQLGQLVYSSAISTLARGNIQLSATHLSKGFNFVAVVDSEGNPVLETKILKN